jgi:hypothetical protein
VLKRNVFNCKALYVNEDQKSAEDGAEEDKLVRWYLEQREAELETQDDLMNEKALAKKVLKRLVKVRFIRRDILASEKPILAQNQVHARIEFLFWTSSGIIKAKFWFIH